MRGHCYLCGEPATIEDREGLWLAVGGCLCGGFDVSHHAWHRIRDLPAMQRQALGQEALPCHAIGGRLRIPGTLIPICRQTDPVPRVTAT